MTTPITACIPMFFTNAGPWGSTWDALKLWRENPQAHADEHLERVKNLIAKGHKRGILRLDFPMLRSTPEWLPNGVRGRDVGRREIWTGIVNPAMGITENHRTILVKLVNDVLDLGWDVLIYCSTLGRIPPQSSTNPEDQFDMLWPDKRGVSEFVDKELSPWLAKLNGRKIMIGNDQSGLADAKSAYGPSGVSCRPAGIAFYMDLRERGITCYFEQFGFARENGALKNWPDPTTKHLPWIGVGRSILGSHSDPDPTKRKDGYFDLAAKEGRLVEWRIDNVDPNAPPIVTMEQVENNVPAKWDRVKMLNLRGLTDCIFESTRLWGTAYTKQAQLDLDEWVGKVNVEAA